MSSTKAKKEQLRIYGDYLTTPVEEIRKFLWFWNKTVRLKKFKTILDPCAGGLKKSSKKVQLRKACLLPGTKMSYPQVLKQFGCKNIITNDIRKNSPARYHFDYLKQKGIFKVDLIITNPPFFFAEEIIEKALKDVKIGGYVVMLLRLNFLGSKHRQKLWQQYLPKQIFVHTVRMSFWPDGGVDSIEYMHCIWQKGFKGNTTLELIY